MGAPCFVWYRKHWGVWEGAGGGGRRERSGASLEKLVPGVDLGIQQSTAALGKRTFIAQCELVVGF